MHAIAEAEAESIIGGFAPPGTPVIDPRDPATTHAWLYQASEGAFTEATRSLYRLHAK